MFTSRITTATAITAVALAGLATSTLAPSATASPHELAPCSAAVEEGGTFTTPDFNASNASPDDADFQIQGEPGATLCIKTGRTTFHETQLDANGYGSVHLPWGPHMVWQSKDGKRSSIAALNLDCWDPTCRPGA